jgi:hypothetical protein
MRLALCVLAVMFLSAASTRAETLTFIATGPVVPALSGLNENPAHPQSQGTGTGVITWDTLTNIMTVNVVFSGLTTPNTAAHIHCCIDPPGNAGVATTVPTFTGFPSGTTSGTYAHTFDMLLASSYNPAFITSHGGTAASAAAALLAGMRAGQTYLNIHTTMFTGGEIRGFLVTPVDLSIKPDAEPPVPINVKDNGNGTTPVAILSTASFNAPAVVDTSTLTFGRTGDEDSLAFCNPGGEDINGDGLLDLVCHFRTRLAEFESGDTLAFLKGSTSQGGPIFGQEAIRTVP